MTDRHATSATAALFGAMRAKRSRDIAGMVRLLLDIAWDDNETIRTAARSALAELGVTIADEAPQAPLAMGEVA